MKNFFSFFVLQFSFQLCVAQTITGIVTDSQTHETLPFASVYLQKNKIGSSTDINGAFSITLKNSSNNDTLVCSYIGYETIHTAIEIGNKQAIKINLKKSVNNLQEIVVKAEVLPSGLELIKKAIQNIPLNYSTIPLNLDGYYRETVKENDKYIQLNEAKVAFYFTGYPQQFDTKSFDEWFYDDRYAIDYNGTLELFMGWNGESQFGGSNYNTTEDQVKIIASRSSENFSRFDEEPTPGGGPLALTAMDKVKYQYDFLYDRNFKKYTYNLKGIEIINGKSCYVIGFHPNGTIRNMVMDQGEKFSRATLVGKIYIEIVSYAITKFEYQIAKNVDFGFFAQALPLENSVQVEYQKIEGKWYLYKMNSKSIRTYSPHFNNKEKELVQYEAERNLVINNVKIINPVKFKDDETLKHTRFTTIRYLENVYNPLEWKDSEYSALNDDIRRDLEVTTSLEVQFAQRFSKNEFQEAPRAKQIPFNEIYSKDTIYDPYNWLSVKDDSTVVNYLKRENKYADNYIIPYKNIQKKLYKETNHLFLRDTLSLEKSIAGEVVWLSDSVGNTGLYKIVDSSNRQIIWNSSPFKKTHPLSNITNYKLNPATTKIACKFNVNGGIIENLYIQPVGKDIIVDSILSVYTFEWVSDSSILYSKQNKSGRAGQLYIHTFTGKISKDSLLYEEQDSTYDISLTSTAKYILVNVESKDENEYYILNKSDRSIQLKTINKREPGHAFSVKEYGGELYILTNKDNPNRRLYSSDLQDTSFSKWTKLAKGKKHIVIEDFLITNDFIVVLERVKGFQRIRYKSKTSKKWKDIPLKEKFCSIELEEEKSTTNAVNFIYSSPITPYTSFSFDIASQKLQILYKPKMAWELVARYFNIQQLSVTSKDGTKIPVTIIRRKDHGKSQRGLILKVYGAYGASYGGNFNEEDIALLNDGFTITYAHVRGGGELGGKWYAEGKLLNKKNSFDDYIACAEYLIKKGYTTSQYLVGYGNSAGGLIMGYVINERPELFNTVILDHPYLDVLNSMMNDSLPLTTDEYKELGDPRKLEVYKYMKSYSPYQNIKKQAYPNLLFIAGYNDEQTKYWQVAKYVASLRENNTGKSVILLKTNMQGGHMNNLNQNGLKEKAFEQTFIYSNLFKKK